MRRVFRHLDKVLVACGVLALLGSAAFAFFRFKEIDVISTRNPTTTMKSIPYDPQTARVPSIDAVSWPDAGPQSRGREWVYDVFTPPVIYYNRETGQFTVTPPTPTERAVTPEPGGFAVELVSVRQEPYRIQLVGYVGTDSGPLATLQDVESGDLLVGRAGKEFVRQQFTLKSFDIRQVTTSSSESMPVIETIGFAIVHDQRTGREETLTNRERKMLPRLQAVLRLLTDPPEERAVREGESLPVDGYDYLIAQLSLNPPQAVVSRRASDATGTPDTRTLSPSAPRGGRPFGQKPPPTDIFSFPSR